MPPRARKMEAHSTDRSPLYITGILILYEQYICTNGLQKRLAHVAYSLSYVLCISFAIVITEASGHSFPLLRSNSICSLVHTSEFDCVNRRKKQKDSLIAVLFDFLFSAILFNEIPQEYSELEYLNQHCRNDGIANRKKCPLQCQFD